MVERKGFQTSAKNYIKAAATLGLVAENVTGVTLPNEAISDWETMMYAIRIGDDRVDSITDSLSRSDFKKHVMGFLKNENILSTHDEELIDSMTGLKNICEGLPTEKRDSLLSAFEALLRVTEKLRNTTDARHYSFLTRLEGQLTSRLFLATLPDNFAASPKYKKLVTTFTRFGRFADTIDNLSDLSDDAKEDLIAIKPSAYASIQLLFQSLPDALGTIRNLKLNKHIVSEILIRTKETIENNPRK